MELHLASIAALLLAAGGFSRPHVSRQECLAGHWIDEHGNAYLRN